MVACVSSAGKRRDTSSPKVVDGDEKEGERRRTNVDNTIIHHHPGTPIVGGALKKEARPAVVSSDDDTTISTSSSSSSSSAEFEQTQIQSPPRRTIINPSAVINEEEEEDESTGEEHSSSEEEEEDDDNNLKSGGHVSDSRASSRMETPRSKKSDDGPFRKDNDDTDDSSSGDEYSSSEEGEKEETKGKEEDSSEEESSSSTTSEEEKAGNGGGTMRHPMKHRNVRPSAVPSKTTTVQKLNPKPPPMMGSMPPSSADEPTIIINLNAKRAKLEAIKEKAKKQKEENEKKMARIQEQNNKQKFQRQAWAAEVKRRDHNNNNKKKNPLQQKKKKGTRSSSSSSSSSCSAAKMAKLENLKARAISNYQSQQTHHHHHHHQQQQHQSSNQKEAIPSTRIQSKPLQSKSPSSQSKVKKLPPVAAAAAAATGRAIRPSNTNSNSGEDDESSSSSEDDESSSSSEEDDDDEEEEEGALSAAPAPAPAPVPTSNTAFAKSEKQNNTFGCGDDDGTSSSSEDETSSSSSSDEDDESSSDEEEEEDDDEENSFGLPSPATAVCQAVQRSKTPPPSTRRTTKTTSQQQQQPAAALKQLRTILLGRKTTTTYNAEEDPHLEARGMILEMLTHGHNCQARGRCRFPSCNEAKAMIRHVSKCTAGPACTMSFCEKSQFVLKHGPQINAALLKLRSRNKTAAAGDPASNNNNNNNNKRGNSNSGPPRRGMQRGRSGKLQRPRWVPGALASIVEGDNEDNDISEDEEEEENADFLLQRAAVYANVESDSESDSDESEIDLDSESESDTESEESRSEDDDDDNNSSDDEPEVIVTRPEAFVTQDRKIEESKRNEKNEAAISKILEDPPSVNGRPKAAQACKLQATTSSMASAEDTNKSTMDIEIVKLEEAARAKLELITTRLNRSTVSPKPGANAGIPLLLDANKTRRQSTPGLRRTPNKLPQKEVALQKSLEKPSIMTRRQSAPELHRTPKKLQLPQIFITTSNAKDPLKMGRRQSAPDMRRAPNKSNQLPSMFCESMKYYKEATTKRRPLKKALLHKTSEATRPMVRRRSSPDLKSPPGKLQLPQIFNKAATKEDPLTRLGLQKNLVASMTMKRRQSDPNLHSAPQKLAVPQKIQSNHLPSLFCESMKYHKEATTKQKQRKELAFQKSALAPSSMGRRQSAPELYRPTEKLGLPNIQSSQIPSSFSDTLKYFDRTGKGGSTIGRGPFAPELPMEPKKVGLPQTTEVPNCKSMEEPCGKVDLASREALITLSNEGMQTAGHPNRKIPESIVFPARNSFDSASSPIEEEKTEGVSMKEDDSAHNFDSVVPQPMSEDDMNKIADNALAWLQEDQDQPSRDRFLDKENTEQDSGDSSHSSGTEGYKTVEGTLSSDIEDENDYAQCEQHESLTAPFETRYHNVGCLRKMGILVLSTGGARFEAEDEHLSIPWNQMARQQLASYPHPMLRIVLVTGKSYAFKLEDRETLETLRSDLKTRTVQRGEEPTSPVNREEPKVDGEEHPVANEQRNSASSFQTASEMLEIPSSSFYESRPVVYSPIFFKSQKGLLALDDTCVLFQSSKLESGESVQRAMPYDCIAKVLVSPDSHEKALLKLVSEEGKGITFELQDKTFMGKIQNEISNRVSITKEDNQPNDKSKRRNKILYVYQLIEFKKVSGVAMLLKNSFIFSSSNQEESDEYIEIPWDMVENLEASPASSANAWLKFILHTGGSLKFELKNRNELDGLQHDVDTLLRP